MASIYIISDHGKISRHDETLVFHQSDDTKTILFPYKTEHLVLMGNVSLSGDALRLIMKYKLGVTFLSSNGRFNGKLEFGDGKTALVFDLMEEFRSPVADTVCCALFNLGTLSEEDFETHDFSREDSDYPLDEAAENEADSPQSKGILLTKAGLKKVIAAFETKMDSLILYAPTGQKISYKKIIYEQAEHYKRVVSGEETEYKAYYFK